MCMSSSRRTHATETTLKLSFAVWSPSGVRGQRSPFSFRLVAVHGSVLLHAFFMHAGAAVIELRASGFKGLGPWSDAYADAFAADGSILHYAMLLDDTSTGGFLDRLSQGAHLKAWDSWELPLSCPPAALSRLLRRITAANASSLRPGRRSLLVEHRIGATSDATSDATAQDRLHLAAAPEGVTASVSWAQGEASKLLPDPAFGQRSFRAVSAIGSLPTVVSDERVAWSMTLTDLVLRRGIKGELGE